MPRLRMEGLTWSNGNAESAKAWGDCDPDKVVICVLHRNDLHHRAAADDEITRCEAGHCTAVYTQALRYGSCRLLLYAPARIQG